MDVLMGELNKHKRKREAVQPTANKYQKRAELEHEKQEQLNKEEEEKRRKLKEKEKQKEREITELYKIKNQKTEERHLEILDREEVIRRLKARNCAITLFGEDDATRAERLRELELKEPMESLPETLEGSAFQKAAQQEEDEEDIEIQKKNKKEEEDPDFKIEDKQPTCQEEFVLFYFRDLVHKMGTQLKERPEEERKSVAGRMEATKHKQTKEFLRPFF